MSAPYRVVMRINDDYVALDRHFNDQKEGDNIRQQILVSPTYRAQTVGSVGIRVMHWRTFKKICDAGNGCTVSRLKQNCAFYGTAFAETSDLYTVADEISAISAEFKIL